MSAHRKLVHVERIPIRWGEMDAMGAISYPGTVEVQVYADGAATVVFIDRARQKPVRIPQSIRERPQ